ncbi:MAG: ketoacyl-ACP synthase III [Clostridiales bacterium]|nr:ketoacyl-ACP synthase III [Clostridiales bacterium]MCD7830384.1 ketoacyl-ACP synthase III [Clostridiales bacterium]MCD7887858.1 ketoacyl-ACP synthase III [Clostridiales bacterium]
MSFKIIGTGSYVPPKVVTNDDLTVFLDTSDEWISTRSGIKQRHVVTDETTSELATKAAQNALENAGVSADELDMILCATVSSEYISPSIACLLQRNLGAQCPCLDLNAACTAWIYLMDTAAAFFCKGGIRKMLVVGAESMSRILNWHERSTCVLFGDGAGAVVLEAGDNYLGSSFVTAGGDDVIAIPTKKGISPWYERDEQLPLVHMNGQETYKFAVSNFPKRVAEVVAKAGLEEKDLDWVIPHQANKRIIDGAARRMKDIPADHFCVNIQKYGNTSAASIPLAMDEWNRAGKFQRGDLIAMVAFGGGLSSAACLIRW